MQYTVLYTFNFNFVCNIVYLLSTVPVYDTYYQCVSVSLLSSHECPSLVGYCIANGRGVELYNGCSHCHLELQKARVRQFF